MPDAMSQNEQQLLYSNLGKMSRNTKSVANLTKNQTYERSVRKKIYWEQTFWGIVKIKIIHIDYTNRNAVSVELLLLWYQVFFSFNVNDMGYYIMVGMSRIACYDDNSFTYIITYLFSCLSKYYHYNIIRTT